VSERILGEIAVPKEAHSTQWGQPPRMHGPRLCL